MSRKAAYGDKKGGGEGAAAHKPGNGSRKARIEHALRAAVAEAIVADVRDPRVHAATMLTVSRVELNVDMSVAYCYVSIATPDDRVRDAALAGLAKAAGFLRGPVARQVSLQRAPELRFALDESLDMTDKLAEIVRDDEARARAAGRLPAATDPPSGGGAADDPERKP
jgi:ribosome-binding factor A